MASSSRIDLPSLPPFSSTSRSRLQSLYSNIVRQKHSNPASYNANVQWWRLALQSLVSSGHVDPQSQLVLPADKYLVEKLKYEGVGKPIGLGAIIAELRHTNALIPLQHFMNSPQSVYDLASLPWRIASYVVGKPLWWTLEQLNIVNSEEAYSDGEWWRRVSGKYIVLELVEQAADAIIAKQRQKIGTGVTESLYNMEQFRNEFASEISPEGVLSDTDVKVILRFLQRDKEVLMSDNEVIKFIDASDEPASITIVDRGILELKTAVLNLRAQVESIHYKIEECNTKASSNLREGRKPLALSYLRSRKRLEDILPKRLGALDNLESTLLTVEAAAADIEIMKSYETSTATLRAILDHPSLQREHIEETMDAMSSANTDAREIDDAIRVVGGDMAAAELGIDEGEFEAELRDLVKEVEQDKKKAADERTVKELESEKMRVPSREPAVPPDAETNPGDSLPQKETVPSTQ